MPHFRHAVRCDLIIPGAFGVAMDNPMYYRTFYQSPIGELMLGFKEDRLIGLWIAWQKYYGVNLPAGSNDGAGSREFDDAKRWLDRYFSGDRPLVSELNLFQSGSDFQLTIWQILCKIPYGQVKTYGQIAEETAYRLGRIRTSARAVGQAIASNHIAIIVPCHRVVGSRGRLSGFVAGGDAKAWLLKHEGVHFVGQDLVDLVCTE